MKPLYFIGIQTGVAAIFALLLIFVFGPDLGGKGTMFAAIAAGVSYVTSILAYIIVWTSLEKNPNRFTGNFMASILLKMMAGLATLFLVAYKYREFAKDYAVSFLIGYFIFTGVEVFFLYRRAKNT
jgi:Na+-driven multidrug efflux pump